MKRDAVAALPRYLAVHASLGAVVGALSGAILAGTDVIGLATLAGPDMTALVLVPALAGLFAVCAAASALAWLSPHDDGRIERDGRPALRRPALRHAAASRVPALGVTVARHARISCGCTAPGDR